MFTNIGKKIKGLAIAIFIIEAIAAFFSAMSIIAVDEDFVFTGVLVLLIGPLLAWISSWFLYGFGELIDKATEIAENTRPDAIRRADEEKARNLKNLLNKGLISEQEYHQLFDNMSEETAPQPVITTFAPTGNRWTCPICGREQPAEATVCKCGTPFVAAKRCICAVCGAADFSGKFCPKCGSDTVISKEEHAE